MEILAAVLALFFPVISVAFALGIFVGALLIKKEVKFENVALIALAPVAAAVIYYVGLMR